MDSFSIFAADNKDIAKEDVDTYVKDKIKELSHDPEKLNGILDEFVEYAEKENGMSKENVKFAVESVRNICFGNGEVVPRNVEKSGSLVLWSIIIWADQRKVSVRVR